LALQLISAWKSFMCEVIMVSSFPEQAAYLYRLYYCTDWNGLSAASQLLSHHLRVGWWCWPIILTKSFVLWVLYHWNLRRDTWVGTMLVIISYWQHKVNNLQSRKVLHSFCNCDLLKRLPKSELYGLKLFHFSQKQLVWHVD
jgi:hypothetical protein